MVVAVAASLVGTFVPPAVQVAVTGLTMGDAYEITGTAGGRSWSVRAGDGTATATQVVRNDVATPVNASIVYTVVVNGTVAAASAPVVVPWAPAERRASRRALLSSLDGSRSVAFRWIDNRDPRDIDVRATLHTVAGRARPVVVYDLEAGERNTLVLQTDGADTTALRELIHDGAPLMLRTDGTLRDFAPVDFVHVLSAQRKLVTGTIRAWSLGLVYIDDPEPDTLVLTSTWADFNAVYAGSTWAAFNGEWAGQTWADFNVEDWASRA